MSDWVAETVSGETRSLAETFEHIRQQATDLFRQIGMSPHVFSIGAFDGDYPCYVEIHNIAGCDTTGMPQAGSEFFVAGSRVLLPSIVVVGSGRRAVTEDDQRLLRMRLGVQPERPEELMELFAEVNKRASEHFLYGGTISAACHAVWMPRQKSTPGGLIGRVFNWGKEAPPETSLLRMTLYGLNMLEQQRLSRLTGAPALQRDDSGRLVRKTDASGPAS